MLGSHLYPHSLTLFAIPRSLFLLILLHCATTAAQQVQLRNITIPLTSPQITYTPFVCNASTVAANPQSCAGAWQFSKSSDSVSTTGPKSTASGNILPQLFIRFQASVFYLTTVSSSNASVNITISAGIKNVSTVFDSSRGVVSIVNLPANQTTTIIITYTSSPTADQTGPTLFGLQSIILSTPQNSSINSLVPSPTLPTSQALPSTISISHTVSAGSTSVPTSPSEALSNTSKKTKVSQAVGITLGLGFGLTTVAVAAFYYWRKRKQQRTVIGTRIEDARSEWSKESFRFSRQTVMSRLSRFSCFNAF